MRWKRPGSGRRTRRVRSRRIRLVQPAVPQYDLGPVKTSTHTLPNTARIFLVSLVALIALALPAAAQQPVRVDVLIGFARLPGAAEEALVRMHGGQIKHTYHLVNAIAASVPANAVDALRRDPDVTVIEMDGRVHTNDAELDNTWGVKQIGGGTVHANGFTGAGVTVAILDSGIDYTHPDLGGCFGAGCKVAGGQGSCPRFARARRACKRSPSHGRFPARS